jgi:putative endonuclease
VEQLNNRESDYTANKIPWKIAHLEIFNNEADALRREKSLKKYSHRQIEELSKSYKNQLQQLLPSQ